MTSNAEPRALAELRAHIDENDRKLAEIERLLADHPDLDFAVPTSLVDDVTARAATRETERADVPFYAARV